MMKRTFRTLMGAVIFALLLTACQNQLAPTPQAKGVEKTPQGESQVESQIETELESQDKETSSPSIEVLGHYNITFRYKNHIYDYELEAFWDNVIIKQEVTNLYSMERTDQANALGFEILMDGTLQMFEEMDADVSGDITKDEWGDFQEDFPFETAADLAGDGALNFNDFSSFTGMFMGMDLPCNSHTLTDPQEEGFMVEDNGGASLKILRAAKGGASLHTGFGDVQYPEGTVFIELMSDFDIYAHDGQGNFLSETSPGFSQPLLSMLIESDFEKAAGGALGFSSIVNATEFNRIFSGGIFELNYDGVYEGDTMDTYYLKIEPSK